VSISGIQRYKKELLNISQIWDYAIYLLKNMKQIALNTNKDNLIQIK